MVHRDLNDIIFTKNIWKRKKPVENVYPNIGWDTETVNGKCVVLANSLKECWVYGVDWFDISEIFYIITRTEYNKNVNWFYNLTYDTNSFLAYLPIKNHEEIAEFGVTDYKGYRIRVIPDKELKISILKSDNRTKVKQASKRSTTFYDMAEMYNYQSLESLAIKYTTHHKPEIKDIANLNLTKIINNNGGYRVDIKNRCVMDCVILKEIADIFTEKVNEIVPVNTYRSKASIARQYVLTHIRGNVGSPPKVITQCALWAYHGGLIEVLKLGRFRNVHNYDIRSAYPSEIAELYSTNGMQVYNNEYVPETAYSFFEIEIDYTHDQISPFWLLHKAKNYHPNGKQVAWINKAEIEFLMDKGFDFKILKGRHLYKRSEDDQPFKYLIHDLYQRRLDAKDAKDEDLQKVIKIILNSTYGVTLNTITKKKELKSIIDSKTGELSTDYIDAMDNGDTSEYDIKGDCYKEVGNDLIRCKTTQLATNMYNPIFGAEITANVRMAILNTFWDKFERGDVISINTDGVFMVSKSNIKLSSELGSWDYKYMPNMVFIGNGRYISLNELEQVINSNSANRGLPIAPDKLWSMINDHKNENVVKTSRERPVKLRESLTRNEYKGKLNQFVEQDRVLYARHLTRHWYDKISTFKDLLDNQMDSRPFNVNEIV